MYREAGADMLFVEAPKTRDDLARMVAALGANAAADGEHGRGRQDADPAAAELEAIGFALVIFPGAIVRALGHMASEFYGSLATHGIERAVPQPHARLRRHQRADRHAGDDRARPALRDAAADKKSGAPVTSLDPVTLAVLNGRLVQIADEMDATLYRSAFNPIIAEAHDACHGLYHAETGATLVQGTSGLPIFVGAMAFAVKAVIDKVARDGDLEAGDTYLFNDPYDGGTHLNDFRLVRPLMRGGRVFAWIASVGHWLDIGGNVPGNYNPKATESFQEGVRIPPVKLLRAGVIQQDIVDILAANSRVPQSNWGDLNGQINALDLGERRLHALLDEYGDDTITAALAALSARAEALMRANIAALPDGTYTCDDFLDNDGVTDEPLRIALDLTIAGDTHDARFLALGAALRRPAQHRALDRDRLLLCRAQAPVHRRAGQRRMPRADRIRHPRHDAARGLGAAAGRRLHRDHPARHRRDLRRLRQGRARARQRQPVRHHQRAVARRLARAPPALDHVLLLRRRPRRQSRRATGSITATTRSRPRPSRRWKSWSRSIR